MAGEGGKKIGVNAKKNILKSSCKPDETGKKLHKKKIPHLPL